MKKLLNTLYVTQQDVSLKKDGETVAVEKEKRVILRLPIHNLSGIVVIGNAYVSPYLMNMCAARGVGMSFLTESGRFLARVEGPVSGNVRLRIDQHHAYEADDRKANLARSFVIGKVVNARSVVMRCMRDHGETKKLKDCESRLYDTLRRLREPAISCDRIRGIEGEAAAVYFSAFDDMIVMQKDVFAFHERSRRPPLDPINALLSYAYVLLAHECRSALEAVGLDPQIGFLHELRSGRHSLALDLMEEFRACLADRLVLSLVNLQQIGKKGFKMTESGAVELSDEAKKTLLGAWQKKKQDVVQHPFIDEKVPIGLLPHMQAQLLARHLRGDYDAYPPFLLK